MINFLLVTCTCFKFLKIEKWVSFFSGYSLLLLFFIFVIVVVDNLKIGVDHIIPVAGGLVF